MRGEATEGRAGTILVALLLMGGAVRGFGQGAADEAGEVEAAGACVLHLKGGQELEGQVIEVGAESLKWRFRGASGASTTPYGQIDYVELPDYARFRFADELLEAGDWERARGRLEGIVKDDEEAGYYPVPGNYIDRARYRLVRIYRQEADGVKVAEHFRALGEERLPPEERVLGVVDEAWALAGEEKWGAVLKLVEGAGDGVRGASSDGAELAYLEGRAQEALGNLDGALDAYYRSYSFNYSGNVEVARMALRGALERTVEADAADEGIVAMLKMYASAFGKGKLWEGHPEELGERLAESLKTEAPGTDTGAEVARGTAVAKEAMDEGDGVVMKSDFEPGGRAGRVRGGGGWDEGELGAGFRSGGPGDTYMLASEDGLADPAGAAVYEPGFTYGFSVTTISEPEPGARCRIELGYLKQGQFVLLRKIEGVSGVGGRAGSKFRFRHQVAVRIDTAERAKGYPVAVRISGLEGTTVFLNDGVVKREMSG